MKRILSIDGGGIRGIIPAMVLAAVEKEKGRAVSQMFDLVVGTSTGGIIALALAMPRGDEGPWSASDLVELYEKEGATIFSRSVWHRVFSVGEAFDERYPSEGIEGVLARYFGDARLSQALVPVVVTSYDLEHRRPFFFKSEKARVDPSQDHAMRDAARATSAAPTYFEPLRLDTGDPGASYTLVDGGVFANNPAMCAWAEVSSGGVPADAKVLSLGTGELIRPIHYEDARDWGLLGWAKPILSVVMDGVSDATDYQLSEMLGPERYLRVTRTLDLGSDDMDDASKRNVHALKAQAEQLLEDHGEDLMRFCD